MVLTLTYNDTGIALLCTTAWTTNWNRRYSEAVLESLFLHPPSTSVHLGCVDRLATTSTCDHGQRPYESATPTSLPTNTRLSTQPLLPWLSVLLCVDLSAFSQFGLRWRAGYVVSSLSCSLALHLCNAGLSRRVCCIHRFFSQSALQQVCAS